MAKPNSLEAAELKLSLLWWTVICVAHYFSEKTLFSWNSEAYDLRLFLRQSLLNSLLISKTEHVSSLLGTCRMLLCLNFSQQKTCDWFVSAWKKENFFQCARFVLTVAKIAVGLETSNWHKGTKLTNWSAWHSRSVCAVERLISLVSVQSFPVDLSSFVSLPPFMVPYFIITFFSVSWHAWMLGQRIVGGRSN